MRCVDAMDRRICVDVFSPSCPVANFHLSKGTSYFNPIIHVYNQPDHPDLVAHLLSRYLMNQDIPMRVTGAANSVPQVRGMQTCMLPHP